MTTPKRTPEEIAERLEAALLPHPYFEQRQEQILAAIREAADAAREEALTLLHEASGLKLSLNDMLKQAYERGADAAQRPALNLLAVMHRDGGHHTAEVGFEQSCKDAEEVRHQFVVAVDAARQEEREALRAEVEKWPEVDPRVMRRKIGLLDWLDARSRAEEPKS